MEQFATASDLESRWRSLSDLEKQTAETKLMDASAIIASMCKKSGVAIDPEDELQAYNIKVITCEMVKRAMLAPIDQPPVSNWSQSAGGYSESATYVNPDGDLYLKEREKKILGIGSQRMFSIRPTGGAEDAN